MDEIIERHFQEAVSFISSSGSSSSTVTASSSAAARISVVKGGGDHIITNAIKLRLYGYYKCATTTTATIGDNTNSSTMSRRRPSSLLNPVQRAKYDAIVDCYKELQNQTSVASPVLLLEKKAKEGGRLMNGEQQQQKQCCGNDTTTTTTRRGDSNKEIRLMAMKCYVELVANYSTDCAVIYNSLMVQMGELLQQNNKDGGYDDNNNGVNSNNDVNDIHDDDDKDGDQQLKVGESSEQRQYNNGNNKVASDPRFVVKKQQLQQLLPQLLLLLPTNKYFLPPPILPRGKIDISYRDIFYVIYLCVLYEILSMLHDIMSKIPLISQLLLLVSSFVGGGRQSVLREMQLQKEIESCWLTAAAAAAALPTTNVVNNKEEEYQVVVGLSVRSLLDLYLSAMNNDTRLQRHIRNRSNDPSSTTTILSSSATATTITTTPNNNTNSSLHEVIIVPPVSIPGMINVLHHHNIMPVPVDLLPPPPLHNNNDNDDDIKHQPQWGIDIHAIESSITANTIAIMIVHPFGAVITSTTSMAQLHTMAKKYNIELWEDCAQCYSGRANSTTTTAETIHQAGGYSGSHYANISFFSFGPIKTATALGGGLAILRNTTTTTDKDGEDDSYNSVPLFGVQQKRVKEVACTMRRVQDTTYPVQTNMSYLIRVLKCLIIRIISDSSTLTGFAHYIITNVLGWEYDEVVLSLLRGFSPPSTSSSNNIKPMATVSAEICQLRKRPCVSLLSLLHRRILDSDSTYERYVRRMDQCHTFANKLLSIDNDDDGRTTKSLGITPLMHSDKNVDMYGWIFPIIVPTNPKLTSQMLLTMGYDIPFGGMTQLRPIDDIVKNRGNDRKCPRACDVFDHILYLPVMDESLDGDALIDALVNVVTMIGREDTNSKSNNVDNDVGRSQDRQSCIPAQNEKVGDQRLHAKQRRGMGMVTISFIVIVLIESYYAIFGMSRMIILPVRFTLRITITIIPMVCTVVLCAVMLLLALCQYMGPIYLQSSNTFAKYCDMLFRSPFQRHELEVSSNNDNGNGGNIVFIQSKTVLELESTKIPSFSVLPDDINSSNGNSERQLQQQQQTILLTGATGFIGSLLLRELLLHRLSLAIPGGVVVIVRPKRGKSAQERINSLLSHSMYNFLSDVEKHALVHVIEGDVTLPDCGMKIEAIESLCRRNISHIFHCAAAVSFSQTLEESAVSNVTSTLQLHVLARRLRRQRNLDIKFVYISTAFVHGGSTGTPTEPLPEEVFSLRQYDALELYKSMLGSQSYASIAMNDLGHPNTYTFSKCICEQLLLQASTGIEGSGVKTIIIRPSIVGPSVQEPVEGWAGVKPSTIVAAACLYLKFPYNIWCFGQNQVPFIPVDVVCRFVIAKSFGDKIHTMPGDELNHDNSSALDAEDEKKEMSPGDNREQSCLTNYTIATVAWDASSPSGASFSWLAYAFSITHLGVVCGHVNRVVAYLGLLLSTILLPRFKFRLDTYQRLHSMFVRAPLNAALDSFDRLPFMARYFRDLKVLSPIIDLPILFYPFANHSYYFKSDIVAPQDFNGERYMFSCAVAAHRFIQTIDNQRRGRPIRSESVDSNLREYSTRHSNSIVVAGANHVRHVSDLWWAITQPNGNMTIRLGAWILTKIFRYTSIEIEVDVASFRALSRELSMSSSLKTTSPHVIIAPTHRSFYDFLIVSYVCFALPELGYDLPHIAASSDFESIPIIGWLARRSHAFFLNRDGTKNDNLNDNLSRIVKNKQRPAFIEVFIEGKRSRTRTFVKPKSGFLRCLSRMKHDYIIIPLTINYEGIPDEESLVKEANSGCAMKMSLTKLANWLHRIYSGTVNIGRVYVSASGPMHDFTGSDINELAYAIQSHQQSQMLVSNYHVRATSLALGMSEQAVLKAMLELGCNFWPESDDKQMYHQPPDNCDLQWAAMLQLSHLLGPYLRTSHQLWSSWTCPASDRSDAKVATCAALIELLTKLTESFDLAQNEVDLVFNYLQSKGFDLIEEKHLVKYLPVENQIPMFLMQVVIKEIFANASGPSRFAHRHNVDQITPVFQKGGITDSEAFGAWGYQDSCFVLTVKPDGSKSVTMKGSRYSISGKPMSRLAPFVEEELNIVIDPTSRTFPISSDLRCIQQSCLCTESVKQLVALLGDDKNRVSLRLVDCARHGTGHSQEDMFALRTEFVGFRVPDAVVWPRSNKEVQSLVSLAALNSWCLIPFGGGTNVTHATHCPSRDIDPRPMISVDMKLMCQILWINEEDGLAHVEAGITGSALIESIEKRGFTIGHEPDSYEFSTLGGWIATKASGMKQNRYGNIEDIVREVSVVGTNGIMSHCHKVEMSSVGRSSTGVDLKSLMIGSEGCLGIIVSAVIKIWPVAECRSHESVLLPNFTIGMRFMKDVSKLRAMKPASVRLLDNDQFRLGQALKVDTTKYASLRSYVAQKIAYQLGNLSEKTVVCVTIAFEGTLEEVKLQEKFIRQLASTYGGILAGSNVGKAGYALTFAIAYLRDFALNYNILGESFETFVPWSKLSQVCCKTKQRIYMEHRSRALPGSPFVCCRITQLYDDGACVYFYFCMDISGVKNPSNIFAEIEHSARQEILIQGGTLSHHHGLGKRTGTLTRQIHSSGYVQALISVKKAIDPKNTFGARNGVFSVTDLS